MFGGIFTVVGKYEPEMKIDIIIDILTLFKILQI